MPVNQTRTRRPRSGRLALRIVIALTIATMTASVTSVMFNLRSAAQDVTATLTMASPSDDARSPDGGGYTDSETWMLIGSGDGESPNVAGFRFTEVMVPSGAVIDSVEFSLVKGTSQWQPVVVDLAFEKSPNAAPFTVVQTPGFRPLTSTRSHVDDDVARRAGRRYTLGNSSQLAASLQEVIDNPGWQIGNSVALIASGPSQPAWARQDFLTRDAGLRSTPQLTIVYHVPGTDIPNEPAPGDNQKPAMVVNAIDLTAREGRGYRLQAVVDVKSDGEPVRDALVDAGFTYQTGQNVQMQKRTNNQGKVTFAISTPQPGTYEFRVKDVSHADMTFDAAGGVDLVATIAVGATEPTEVASSEPAETITETPTHEHEPTETATQTETATETQTATETELDSNQVEPSFDYGQWRPASDHDNGDPPPQWVTDWTKQQAAQGVSGFYSVGMIYGGDEQTSDEWINKPRAFKGYSATLKGVDIYYRYHAQSNPMGHTARFHSYEIYARDPSGNVSMWQGWQDFGTGDNTLPTVRDEDCETDLPRPIMLVNKVGCGEYTFENWYSRPGGTGPGSGWVWDTGLNMQATAYHDGDPHHMESWTLAPDNNKGLIRRIELAWYADRAGMAPKGEWFWATQFGTIVQGPDDPLCGTSRTFGEKTYTVKCLPQYIAPTMVTVSFPDNSSQKAFDCPVCTLPN